MMCRTTGTLLAAFAIGSAIAPAASAQPQRRGISAPDQPEVAISVHVRVAELWKTEPLKEFRSLIGHAGPKALETYLKRFALTPADIDELTVFALTGPPDRSEPFSPAIIVLKTRSPVKEDKLVAFVAPDAKSEKLGDRTVYIDADARVALFLAGPQSIVIGQPEIIQTAFTGGLSVANLAPALAAMASDKIATVTVHRSALPKRELESAPPPFANLLAARRATLTLDLRTDIALQLTLHYANAEAAAEGEKSAREALELGRRQLQSLKPEVGKPLFDPGPATPADWPHVIGSLVGLAAIGQGDELLANLPLSRDGSTVSTHVRLPMQPLPPVAVTAALAAAGFAAYRTEAVTPRDARPPVFRGAEGKTANNLKMIGLALHNYAAAYNAFPPQAITGKDGKPLLSWRVAILPYIEQDSLYKQFKLDEPWDSDHNKKLIDKMPAIFASPNAPPTSEPGLTHLQVFIGGGAAWSSGPRGPRLPDFTDGLSNTILVTQARKAVPWTKPEDMAYDPQKPVPAFFADPNSNAVLFLMGDGSVTRKPSNLPEQLLRAAITRAGGEVVDWSSDGRNQPMAVPTLPAPVPPRTNARPIPPDR